MQPIIPVILAGGKGTRLWPLSRGARPKQFLQLTSDFSLFQQTLLRVNDPSRYGPAIVITNQEYRFLVAEQAQEAGVPLHAVLLEPVARNTAPAIAASAVVAAQQSTDQLIHVLPSDHELLVDDAYLASVDAAIKAAGEGYLVTFGITPTSPITAFGYIEAGKSVGGEARSVKQFTEKPDKKNAKRMIETGNYYWNSGMFLFSAQRFLDECKKLQPKVHAAAEDSVAKAVMDLDFTRLDEKSFAKAPDISVDYAIFEKTKHAAVVPSKVEWSDLGSWDAVWKTSSKDAEGNVVRGPVTLTNSSKSLVISESLHVALDGMEDALVIASEDAVYVGRLSAAQGVGEVVKGLKANADTAHLTETHVTSYRPWGGYSSVLSGERFQVKRLFVKPGKALSLQKHHHRSEHWIVVRGTAEVTVGKNVQTMRENESVYIPQGEVHRLANPGKILLELIEVQTGSYLGEDDIIRLEDAFGRV